MGNFAALIKVWVIQIINICIKIKVTPTFSFELQAAGKGLLEGVIIMLL